MSCPKVKREVKWTWGPIVTALWSGESKRIFPQEAKTYPKQFQFLDEDEPEVKILQKYSQV